MGSATGGIINEVSKYESVEEIIICEKSQVRLAQRLFGVTIVLLEIIYSLNC